MVSTGSPFLKIMSVGIDITPIALSDSVGIYIELTDNGGVAQGFSHLFDNRVLKLAGSAPFGVKVDKHWLIAFEHLSFKIGISKYAFAHISDN
jgi:hypothetical protein